MILLFPLATKQTQYQRKERYENNRILNGARGRATKRQKQCRGNKRSGSSERRKIERTK
jgi:hypothetical protein